MFTPLVILGSKTLVIFHCLKEIEHKHESHVQCNIINIPLSLLVLW